MAIGLYYPFINFKSDEWLKLASLYWNKVGRIVPPGYETRDSDTVKALRDEFDFVSDFDPSSAAQEVGERFVKVLIRNETALRDHYAVAMRHEWPEDPHTAALSPDGSESLAYVYVSKMPDELREALIGAELAIEGRGDDLRWIGMRPVLVEIYMAALTHELAQSGIRGGEPLSPTTDETLTHVAGSGWSVDRITAALLAHRLQSQKDDGRIDGQPMDIEPVGEQVESALAFMAIQSVVPDLKGMKVEDLIRIRKALSNEFRAFHEHLDDVAGHLGVISEAKSRDVAMTQLSELHAKHVDEPLRELKRGLKTFNVDTTISTLDISVAVPTVVSALALPPVVAVGAAVAYGVTRFVRDARADRQRLVAESPVAYLLHLEEGLNPQSVLGWIREHVQGFLRGNERT